MAADAAGEAQAVGRFPACLEIGSDGWCIVHFPAVPGAGFKAPGISEAVRAAPSHLGAEMAWLRARGLAPLELAVPWSVADEFMSTAEPHISILETARTGAITAAGDSEAYFGWCGGRLTPELTGQILAHLEAGREQLLAQVAERGDDWLDVRAGPGKRSPREVLHHLADAELFYLVRLSPSQAEARANWAAWSGRGEPETDRLAGIRQLLVQALTALADPVRGQVTVHDPHAERWTPLKIAYRAVWHERYSTRLLRL